MKTLKAFVYRDDFIDNAADAVATIFELSDKSNSYARDKKQFYLTGNSLYSLKAFRTENGELTQIEADNILSFIAYFTNFATANPTMSYQDLIVNAVSSFNVNNPIKQVTNFSYNTIETLNNVRTAKYFYFIISDVECLLWTSDSLFQLLYPDYEISITLPFSNFSIIINNTSQFLTALDNFDLLEFNNRLDLDKEEYPSTNSRTLNIPYKVPNTNVLKNCYFGFNIYGVQGNYEDVIKLELYEYLLNMGNLTALQIESLFPSLLEINEFFFIPRYDKVAIPSHVGQNAIYSQLALAYNEPFDLDRYLTIYPVPHLRAATYNLPTEYNNTLVSVTNGYYSKENVRDFKEYYKDIIAVSTTEIDFARMSTRTQQFMNMFNVLLYLSNSDTFLDVFNKLVSNNLNNEYRIRTRNNITYISKRFEDHVYYILPKYEFARLR